MKVLFIDDEEAILSGLRRMLRSTARDWETTFAVGGEAGLAMLEDRQFDVVVTDMRMPTVDGATVLARVRDRHPATVRIVLSGHNELASALRTVPLAHQVLAKPCDPTVLRAAVERARGLQESLLRTELLPVVGGIDALPSPPAVITRLNGLLAEAEVDVDEVVALVSADPAICAKLLQLVNSAFFGVARSVGDVATAIRYLGLVRVRDLAVAVHAFRAAPADPWTAALVEEMQTHSTAVAELAQLLATPDGTGHDAYVAALLHDIGSLVLATWAGDEYRALLEKAKTNPRPLHELEEAAFGASHADIGGWFLSVWGLPYDIIDVVVSHHRERDPVWPLNAADATWLAEALAERVGSGGAARGTPSELNPELLERDEIRVALEAWPSRPMNDRESDQR